MGELKLYLFGPPRLELDNVPVDIERRKALALLAYLAVTGQPHSRDALATLFWPDLDQQRARAYFRRDLAVLNAGLPGGWLIADRDTVELNREADPWVDTTQFQRLLAACQRHSHPAESVCPDCLPLLSEAVALYTGDFLAGFTLRDSPEFDDWQFFQSESLRQDLALALERLVRGLSSQGAYEAALPLARRWVALDPLHEPAQQQLMQLYHQAGQPAAALRQYDEYVKLLEEELGLPPEEETTTLYEAIKAKRFLKPFLKARQDSSSTVEALPHRPAPPTPVTRATPRHNLPSELSPFIGREAELGQIQQLLLEEPDCRLLTLVGPGGIGKTRLALAAAAALLAALPQGVYFVSLAPVREPEMIVSAIAEALNFNFAGAAEPKDQLLTYLGEKNLLLVMDNFEHLISPPTSPPEGGRRGGAELLSEILQAAPRIVLLITSRERLNLQEEWSFEVGGMTFPLRGERIPEDDSAALEPYSAVRLFLQRARQAKASFSLSTEDMLHVVRICELVDGLPLALELAAPWVRLMPCREIAAELERNVDILSTSLRNVPERHRSVRAIFEQTWERLLPEEQAVLRQLSIFRGGCLRPAAEAVTGATLPRLLSLVDKALLRRTGSGRFEMHELIRQFSLEQLQTDSAEYRQVQDRYYAYFTAFLGRDTEAIKGGQQKQALEAITADFDNIRAAWQGAVECKDVYALEQAAECLCLYSEMRGALHEGEAAFQQAAAALTVPSPALDRAAEAQENLRGFLLAGQGMLRAHRGELQTGQSLMEQGLSLLRQFPHPERQRQQEAFTLLWLGWIVFLQGKTGEAEQHIEESLTLFSAVGDRWGRAKSLFVLGNSLTARGLLAESEPPLRESLAICQEIDDRRSHLLVNRNLAILTLWFGDYDQTRQLLDEAASLSQEFNDQIGLAYTLRERGVLEMAQGEYGQAMQTLQESIAITDEMGSQWESAAALDDVGAVLRLTGDYVAAEWALKQCLEASQAINNRYYTARCLGSLSCVAYHKGDYQQAEQQLQQALAMWDSMGHDPYRAWVLSQLGHVAAARKDRPTEAKDYYRQALQLSTRHNLAPFGLEVFVGVTRLLSQAGQTEYIAQLLTLAQHHPAGTFETKEAARGLMHELTPAITGEVKAAASASDPALDWQRVAEQIIGVLST
jgi:predicted ATPase/DNA-binding SARP family transcriptional activator